MKKNKSLFEKEMENPSLKKKFEDAEKQFEIEYQILALMEKMNITQKDLAELLVIDKSVVSKDLSGSLKKAGLQKINKIVSALDCEFIPLIVPKKNAVKVRKKLIAEKIIA